MSNLLQPSREPPDTPLATGLHNASESQRIPNSEDDTAEKAGARGTRRRSGRQREGIVVRAGGLEPPQALRPYGFSYQLRLSPPRSQMRVCGLDYPFTVRRQAAFRCCPSSLYTFPPRGGLGSGLPGERLPRIWAVLRRGFPRGHSRQLSSPLRLPVSPRPRDAVGIAKLISRTNYACRLARSAPNSSR